MKKIIFVLMLLVFSGLFAEKPVVAVLEIDNKTAGKNKLSQYDAELIADMMRDELIQSQEFIVMSKEDMESAIAQHVKKSHQLNKDKNYAIELGKQISARYIISSQIKTDGKFFRIFAEIIDTETGKSPRSGKAKFAMDDDSKDAAIAGLIRQLLGERDESLIPKKPKKSEGQIACEEARAAGSEQKWKGFLKYYADEYPECVPEARKQLEEIAFLKAEREDSAEAWQEYLDEYPMANKRHAITAEERIEKLKKEALQAEKKQKIAAEEKAVEEKITAEKVGNLYWSEKAPQKMNLNEAQGYCRRLNEAGISGWRLPTIDELRTLVQNCPGTMTGGTCKISAASGCLASYCLSSSCQCGVNSSGKYSIFGDTEYLLSSSQSDGRVYIIDFSRAGINNQHSGNKYNVRCVK